MVDDVDLGSGDGEFYSAATDNGLSDICYARHSLPKELDLLRSLITYIIISSLASLNPVTSFQRTYKRQIKRVLHRHVTYDS